MDSITFIRKYRRFFSIYNVEMHNRMKRNSIAHAIGKEKRKIDMSELDKLDKFLIQLEADINKVPAVSINKKQLKLKLK